MTYISIVSIQTGKEENCGYCIIYF